MTRPLARGRIRLLSETTVNRIAAGEVIERPAAAVKELVENAIDAGASRISVALDGGGIDRIEVSDDGFGMNSDELGMAVLRHATSKLTDETLQRIATLGFRGEALPSIGSAARLSITSRPIGAEHASAISVEGGLVGAVGPAAGAQGTRVVVRDLFFATPARRKFLKNPRTEADHAEAAVRRLAFAAPEVAFRLEIDGRTVFDLPKQDNATRVAALLGVEAAAALLPVEHVRGDLRLTGFACSPFVTRATAAGQSLVVNDRPVADPVLRTAVRVAYRDVIVNGRYPVVALRIEVPPDELDVNVHPAKTELRFRDVAAVRALVIGGVGRALAAGAGSVLPTPELGGLETSLSPARPDLHLVYSRPAGSHSSGGGIRGLPLPHFGFSEARLPISGGPVARMLPALEQNEADSAQYPLGAPVAQVLDTYVIAVAADGGLVLVDQHAAHERLMHEMIRAQMLEGGARSQALLLPAVVDMPASDAARLLVRAAELALLGLEIEAFGPGAILVRALPATLGSPEPAPLLRDLADELAELDEAMTLLSRLDAVVARLACHGSIRAGRTLNRAEMSALLRQMEATPRAATCSHGRPTFIKLSKHDIERLFGRR
jgi:DNA mismatch repair protein MutL